MFFVRGGRRLERQGAVDGELRRECLHEMRRSMRRHRRGPARVRQLLEILRLDSVLRRDGHVCVSPGARPVQRSLRRHAVRSCELWRLRSGLPILETVQRRQVRLELLDGKLVRRGLRRQVEEPHQLRVVREDLRDQRAVRRLGMSCVRARGRLHFVPVLGMRDGDDVLPRARGSTTTDLRQRNEVPLKLTRSRACLR